MGCDTALLSTIFPDADFNPRSPNGLRRDIIPQVIVIPIFQSTQPEWAATVKNGVQRQYVGRFQSTQPEWAATADR